MSERFVFELCLGGDVVKRVAFTTERGRRELKTSGGQVIGELVLKPGSLRLDIDEDATSELARADFS
jgi:hypothetical protein